MTVIDSLVRKASECGAIAKLPVTALREVFTPAGIGIVTIAVLALVT